MALVVLNWKEIDALARCVAEEAVGARVQALRIRERPRVVGGYLKNEWAFELHRDRATRWLLFSVRPRAAYLTVQEAQKVRKGKGVTRSAFDLLLEKKTMGLKVHSLRALSRERAVEIEFESGSESRDLKLLLVLIPAQPEALLVENGLILARTSVKKPTGIPFALGVRNQPPKEPEIRTEIVSSLLRWNQTLEGFLDEEAFDSRHARAEREIKKALREVETLRRSAESSLRESQAEGDWQHQGELIAQNLNPLPELVEGKFRELFDYSTQGILLVEFDPKLTPHEQMERYFKLAKRKKRRLEELESRITSFQVRERALREIEKNLTDEAKDWKRLEAAEAALGLEAGVAPSGGKETVKWVWPGKKFTSREGWSIYSGRNITENLDLTFKHAKGNDLWLHLRGKKGAHVIVPVGSGKSVPLETLLDAAHVAIYMSGGEKGGKTDVDYTFKKYVKRIKDSTQVSYTQNKTLWIDFDPERMKRLLATLES